MFMLMFPKVQEMRRQRTAKNEGLSPLREDINVADGYKDGSK